MALIRTRSVFSYSSSAGGVTYTFDVVLDAQGLVTVRNLTGPIAASVPCSSACATNIPEDVLNDMQDAKGLVELLLTETEVSSGTLTFTGQTQLPGAIAPGLLNNTNYRVAYSDPCGTCLWTDLKTTTSFMAVAGVAYGSVAVPIVVPYSVLVSTSATSSFGGSVTFTALDAGVITVSFPAAVSTTSYRVLLTPNGFFVPRVINKTTLGFTIQLGYTLSGLDTATVGFDVFA